MELFQRLHDGKYSKGKEDISRNCSCSLCSSDCWGGFVLSSKKTSNSTQQAWQEEQVLTLKPEDIGLELSLSDDSKKVTMEINKLDGITSLEYQLLYNSKDDVPRGAIGTIDIKGDKIKKEIVLGTCSDVCHYDEAVSDIKIIVKVVKTDGKTYQVEKSLEN